MEGVKGVINSGCWWCFVLLGSAGLSLGMGAQAGAEVGLLFCSPGSAGLSLLAVRGSGWSCGSPGGVVVAEVQTLAGCPVLHQSSQPCTVTAPAQILSTPCSKLS